MCSYVHTVQRTRIATLYGSGPARGLATPLSGHKAQTLSGITSATYTWEAAPVIVRYGRWTRLINVSLMAFNSSAVRDGSSPHPEAVWVPCLSDRRTLSPDVMIFRATTDSTERHMHGRLPLQGRHVTGKCGQYVICGVLLICPCPWLWRHHI